MVASSKKAKIRWQCRRGMLELDLLLNPFVQDGLNHLTENQMVALEYLLTHSDPVLYAWLMGHEHPEEKELLEIVTIIRSFNQA